MNNHTGTKTKLKTRIVCKKCCTVYANTAMTIRSVCPNCGNIVDARIRTEQARLYNQKHPERVKGYQQYDRQHKRKRGKESRELLRKVVLNLISNNNPTCSNCGCDDIRLLEINHINGGGNKEYQNGKRTNIVMWDIYMGRRKTDDLNLLCKVCNSLHYLEMKYGKTRIKVIYQ